MYILTYAMKVRNTLINYNNYIIHTCTYTHNNVYAHMYTHIHTYI